jgi:hypothetical protein
VRFVPIVSVRVDDQDRIRVRPDLNADEVGYSMIYREAAWIRWDNETKELFVTAEKVEDLKSQFARILAVLAGCDSFLKLTLTTGFMNVPNEVVAAISKESV